jgi:hypothetical protein
VKFQLDDDPGDIAIKKWYILNSLKYLIRDLTILLVITSFHQFSFVVRFIV